jgi:hypothetical protein
MKRSATFARRKRIAADVFDPFSREIEIVVERSGDEALIRGLATAVLSHPRAARSG